MDFFTKFLSENFINCVWIAILLVSLFPTLESKIAIPLAMNSSIWGSKAYSPIFALLISYFGSLIPCIFLIIITRKFLKKTTGFVTSTFLSRYRMKKNLIERGESSFSKYLLLTAFVAVPLPLTGVWSGSIIAGLTDLDPKFSFLSIAIGSFISSSMITLLCTVFENSISYILIISLIIIIIFLFIDLFHSFFRKNK